MKIYREGDGCEGSVCLLGQHMLVIVLYLEGKSFYRVSLKMIFFGL